MTSHFGTLLDAPRLIDASYENNSKSYELAKRNKIKVKSFSFLLDKQGFAHFIPFHVKFTVRSSDINAGI